jgi:hypothetical protein
MVWLWNTVVTITASPKRTTYEMFSEDEAIMIIINRDTVWEALSFLSDLSSTLGLYL